MENSLGGKLDFQRKLGKGQQGKKEEEMAGRWTEEIMRSRITDGHPTSPLKWGSGNWEKGRWL